MFLHVPAEQSDRVEAWRGSDQLAHVRLKGLSECNLCALNILEIPPTPNLDIPRR
jgi:hypothetical protein